MYVDFGSYKVMPCLDVWNIVHVWTVSKFTERIVLVLVHIRALTVYTTPYSTSDTGRTMRGDYVVVWPLQFYIITISLIRDGRQSFFTASTGACMDVMPCCEPGVLPNASNITTAADADY